MWAVHAAKACAAARRLRWCFVTPDFPCANGIVSKTFLIQLSGSRIYDVADKGCYGLSLFRRASFDPHVRWAVRYEMPEKLSGVPAMAIMRALDDQSRQARQVVAEPFRGNEADRIPAGVSDLPKGNGIGGSR